MAQGTMLGIPLPRPGSAPAPTRRFTPSGRYRLVAPEQRNGAVLYVRIEFGSLRSSRLVEVRETGETGSGDRCFVDLDGVSVAGIVSWREATRAEVEAFRLEQRVSHMADVVQLHGAPAFAATLAGLPLRERDDALCAVADALRERGHDGRASQVLAYRWEADR